MRALRALRRPTPSFLADDHPGVCEPPIHDLIERENIEQVRSAIERLPQHYRAALVLCEYENLPYSEIAQVLDATIPASEDLACNVLAGNWLACSRAS